ncbi:MAG: PLP-dependent aminotransferase family protein [Myxococcota bacterium]
MTKDWQPRGPRPKNTPLHEWISKAIADDIAAGHLRPGDALPAQRDLADVLGVALGTVTRGYASARQRGLVVGQRRRGTVVALDPGVDARMASIVGGPPSEIDLAANLPIYAADPDPSEALREIARRPDVRQLLRYPPPEGLPRHRGAAAQWLQAQGVPVVARDIVLSGGAQHGILLALAAVARPGDAVFVEALTYPGVLAAARMLGLNVVPVAIDEQGLDPDALAEAFARHPARALYCIPTLHNPTTVSLSEDRKHRIATIVDRHQSIIIEDEIHRALVPHPRVRTFYEMLPERTVLISAASKSIAGGLRVGFVAAPAALRPPLLSAVQASAFAVGPLGAELFATWLEDGTLSRTLTQKRKEAARRIRLVHDELDAVPGVHVRTADHGYLAWVTLPQGRSASSLAAQAQQRGVRVAAKAAFCATPFGDDDAVRLSVGTAERKDSLVSALRTLKAILTEAPAPTVY